MQRDSTTAAHAEFFLTEEDVERLRQVTEQVWVMVCQTNSPILLSAHQHLTDLRKKITGEED